MRSRLPTRIGLAAAGWALATSGLAQPQLPPPAPATAVANATPTVRNPVAEFRHWLALSAEEREQLLAGKTEKQREYLAAKLREYEGLSPQERESRLNALQLHWYLRPLMEMSGAEREPRLDQIPATQRPLVEERLRQWDLLPVELQKQVLDSEWAQTYFIRLEQSSKEQKAELLATLSPEKRRQLEEWSGLSSERRSNLAIQLKRFFALPAREREKTLEVLPDAERLEMEKTLLAFQKLPPERRQVTLDAFGKFTNMSSEESAHFLRTAERWRAMSAQERALWRNLVNTLPPLPPGMNATPPALPALPPPPR